jgi:nicotinamide mononucleotide transporter
MSPGEFLVQLVNAKVAFGDQYILWREIVGNLFGLASAIGGMRRRLWAWPIGIVGNVLLFTVFLGAAFQTPQDVSLFGQASRQVVFLVVAAYGWYRWRRNLAAGGVTVTPRWASWSERAGLGIVGVIGVSVLTLVFTRLGSYPPVWADAWTVTGTLLATFSMARGWVDFWLVWIGVDVVGVPLLLHAHYYPSAVLYAFYGGFVIWGFTVWLRASRADGAGRDTTSMQEVTS